MKTNLKYCFLVVIISNGMSLENILATGMEHSSFVNKFMLNRLETSLGKDKTQSWSIENWTGNEINKLWIKSDGDLQDNKISTNEMQLLYSRGIAPYWDVQYGVKSSLLGANNRSLVIGLKGIAPYFFEIDGALFLGEKGSLMTEIEIEYELLFSQKIILSPEIKIQGHGNRNLEEDVGEGLSEIEFGIHLRYEFTGNFAYYFGSEYTQSFGKTKSKQVDLGINETSTELVTGIKSWF